MATQNGTQRVEVYRTIIIVAVLAGLYLLVVDWAGIVHEISRFW